MLVIVREDNLNGIKVGNYRKKIVSLLDSEPRIWPVVELGQKGGFKHPKTAEKHAVQVALELGWEVDTFVGKTYAIPPGTDTEQLLSGLRRMGTKQPTDLE